MLKSCNFSNGDKWTLETSKIKSLCGCFSRKHIVHFLTFFRLSFGPEMFYRLFFPLEDSCGLLF